MDMTYGGDFLKCVRLMLVMILQDKKLCNSEGDLDAAAFRVSALCGNCHAGAKDSRKSHC